MAQRIESALHHTPQPHSPDPATTITNGSDTRLFYAAEVEDSKERDASPSGSSGSSDACGAERPALRAMRSVPRLRDLNPLRLFKTGVSYSEVPLDSRNGSPFVLQPLSKYRWPSPIRRSAERIRWCKPSFTRTFVFAVTTVLLLALLGGGGYKHHIHKAKGKGKQTGDKPPPFYWQRYSRLNGYYNGVRTLVTYSEYTIENRYNESYPPQGLTSEQTVNISHIPPLDPIPYRPYPDYTSSEYLKTHHEVEQCYLDAAEKIPAPDVYVYPGLPQNMSLPLYGSYSELGLEETQCFDRFGRLGPYGYGCNESLGGLGPGNLTERAGSEKVFAQAGVINYTNLDWGTAQKRCAEKNSARFADDGRKMKVQKHAYVLRTWTGYYYNDHEILTIRAMINELALKSGGEYDVHLLVHVKDNSIPIWADSEVYRRTLEKYVPQEFWNISTLWSEQLMMSYYPEPFVDNFANMAGSGIHGVYRSAHFPLQWFSQKHPEYDFVWNWEMDIRYTGQYYEFTTGIGEWAKKQPRKGLWERSQRFYIPGFHGSWQNFTDLVERETEERRLDVAPIWGPVQDFPNTGMLAPPNETHPPTSYDADRYEWGVGEDADLIVFNPIFDPALTNWVFSADVTGYNRSLAIPPRRAAIITVARLSKRLLAVMHEEVWRMKHTMFPEMWPATVCMHHGLKAAYAPHPVFFDRDWNLAYMDTVFNHPRERWESPFGWGEHNLLGSSFYYNSRFSGALWRRWLGQRENGEGGRSDEEKGTGRMCLRGTLHHPIKHELGPMG